MALASQSKSPVLSGTVPLKSKSLSWDIALHDQIKSLRGKSSQHRGHTTNSSGFHSAKNAHHASMADKKPCHSQGGRPAHIHAEQMATLKKFISGMGSPGPNPSALIGCDHVSQQSTLESTAPKEMANPFPQNHMCNDLPMEWEIDATVLSRSPCSNNSSSNNRRSTANERC